MNPINLSIVIPTWNREHELQRALNSIKPLLDSSPAIEVIVTDNCSSDQTLDVALLWQKKYQDRFKVLQSNENKGPVLNWEKGFKASSAPFTLLLFSDDFLEPRSISQFKSFIEDSLPSFYTSNISLIRLAVNIFNSRLQASDDNNISLSFSEPQQATVGLVFESRLQFCLNHTLPSVFRFFRRSFSPVSPAGYILSTSRCIQALKLFKNKHTFLKNGAGIDNLLILCCARTSKVVVGVPFIKSCMVASESSITRTSQANPRKLLQLKKSYFISEILFSLYCVNKLDYIGLFVMVFSFLRLAQVNLQLIRLRSS